MWPGWGQDERWIAECLAESDVAAARLPAEFFQSWDRARLDRARDDMPEPGREYTEIHLHRPIEANPAAWLELAR
jgi:hypothetical protein